MNQLRISGVLVVCASLAGFAGVGWAVESTGSLLVDDFDRGEKPNALGGDFGAWDKDPSDPTQKCTNAFDKEHAYGGVGYALRLDYDVDSPNPAYNGFWMKLQKTDVTSYKKLTLYVRGDQAKGFTNQIKLELKNSKKEVGRYLLKGLTEQWQKVTIPLSQFVGITDWKGMDEFVVVFDDITSTKKAGTIYLDEIAFEN